MRAKVNWWLYYYIMRRVRLIPLWVAHRMPKWLKYWVYIDVTADVTTKELSNRITPDVTAVEVLDVIGKRGR